MRKAAIVLASIVIAWSAIEAVSFAGLKVLARYKGMRFEAVRPILEESLRTRIEGFVKNGGAGTFFEHDSELGWVPSSHTAAERGDSINAAGMRDNREYTKDAQPGFVRYSVFGDSFAYGDQVSAGDVWTKRLADLAENTEVLNYGVTGYGLDQAFLRYRKVRNEYPADVVLIGYMSENLARGVNVWRPFLLPNTKSIFSKPRFRLRAGELELLPNPLQSQDDYKQLLADEAGVLNALGENDTYFQRSIHPGPLDFSPTVRLLKMVLSLQHKRTHGGVYDLDGVYDTEGEPYQLALATMDKFCQEVRHAGAVPIVVIFPFRTEFDRALAGQPVSYQPLLRALRQRGQRYIDTMQAFLPVTNRLDKERNITNHFTPLGNLKVARLIRDELERWGLFDPNRVKEIADQQRNASRVTYTSGQGELQEVIDWSPVGAIIACDPDAELVLKQPLRVRQRVSLVGLRARPDASFPKKQPLITVESSDVALAELNLQGNLGAVAEDDRAPLIRVGEGGFRIENCVFSDSSKDGIEVVPGAEGGDVIGGVIRNIRAVRMGRDAVSLSGGSKGGRIRNVTVDNVSVETSYHRGAVEVSDGTDNIRVSNVVARDSMYAVDVQDHRGPSAPNTNVLLEDIKAIDCQNAIVTQNSALGHTGLTIRGVAAEGCIQPIKISNTVGVAIEDIEIKEHTDANSSPILLADCRDVRLDELRIQSRYFAKSPIEMLNSFDVRVDGRPLGNSR